MSPRTPHNIEEGFGMVILIVLMAFAGLCIFFGLRWVDSFVFEPKS